MIFLPLFLLTLVSCGKESSSTTKTEATQETIKPDAYLTLVNQHRVGMGLRPLTHSSIIEEVAFTHASNMAQGSVRFGHSGFKTRCERLQAELGASACGEIVARGQRNETEVLQAWLGSPSHRKSIEKPEYNYTGFSQVRGRGKDGRIYWVQFFLIIP